MNADDVAGERRLDAFLGEAVGGAPSGLDQRVLQRLAASPARARQGQLLAALLMLGGIAVVVAVAVLQHRDATMAQEPQGKEQPTVSVGNADLPAATRVDVAAGADVVTELLRIAKQAGVPILIGDITGTAKKALAQAPWREAMAVLAADAAAGVEELGPLLVVRQTPRPLPYGTRLTCGGTAVDVRDFAKVIATRAGVDLVVAGELHGRVSFEFDDAPWRDALDVVVGRLGGEVEGCGAALALRPRRAAPPAPRTYFAQTRVPTSRLVDTMAKIAGLNVVMSTGPGCVSVRAQGVPELLLLQALARADHASLHHEDRGIYRLDKREPPLQQPVLLTAEDVDLRAFAELVRSATQATVPVPVDGKAKLSVFAKGAPLADLLAAAALATGHKVVDDDKTGLRIE